jgi:hypothetical protein
MMATTTTWIGVVRPPRRSAVASRRLKEFAIRWGALLVLGIV